MKKSIILFLVAFISLNAFSQKSNSQVKAFDVQIIGNGTPLLLIPGLSCSGEVWAETVEALKADYECHILTLAGFAGQAPMESKDQFLPIVEREIIAYLEPKFKGKSVKPIIMGHSLGGFLSLSIAQKTEGLVDRIVIVDSFPFYTAAMMPTATEETAKPQAEIMKTMLLNTTEEAFENQQKMMLGSMITDADKIEVALEWSLQTDRETMGQAMYEIMSTDLRKDMKKANCPILVLGSWAAGKDYGLTKEFTLNTYKTQFAEAENCEILVAEKAKHFIMWDEPVWFMENVKRFLK